MTYVNLDNVTHQTPLTVPLEQACFYANDLAQHVRQAPGGGHRGFAHALIAGRELQRRRDAGAELLEGLDCSAEDAETFMRLWATVATPWPVWLGEGLEAVFKSSYEITRPQWDAGAQIDRAARLNK